MYNEETFEAAPFGCQGGAVMFRNRVTGERELPVYRTEAIVEVEEEIEAEVKENLGGVGQVLDTAQADAKTTGKMTLRRIHATMLAKMCGYTAVRNEVKKNLTIVRNPAATGAFFELRALSKSNNTVGSSTELRWLKCKITTPLPMVLADTEFAEFEVEFTVFDVPGGDGNPDGYAPTIFWDEPQSLSDLFAEEEADLVAALPAGDGN